MVAGVVLGEAVSVVVVVGVVDEKSLPMRSRIVFLGGNSSFVSSDSTGDSVRGRISLGGFGGGWVFGFINSASHSFFLSCFTLSDVSCKSFNVLSLLSILIIH